MKTLTLFVLTFFAFFIRWARWLAIVQQKEYRLDRLVLFINSTEGKQDFWRLIPSKKDFTRTGLKRPRKTARVIMVSLISLGIMVFFVSLLGLIQTSNMITWIGLIVGIIVILYIMLPLIVIISALPTVIISLVLTRGELLQAQAKILKNRPLIIGITGSYGKTTTKLLLAQVLSAKYQVFYTPRSYNTRYSVAKSINQHYQGQEIAILEYGAYTKGEIAVLSKWFPPQIAVITGATLQHAGLFGTIDEIIKAKSELVRALPDQANVFCNAQDEGAALICQVNSGTKRIDYTGKKSVVKLTNISLNKEGKLKFSWNGKLVQTQLVGLHYAQAIQAAIAIGQHFEVSANQIKAVLEAFDQPGNFIQIKLGVNGSTIIDDGGTSNKQGFMAALDLLKWYKKKHNTILITSGIVDLGVWSEQIHQELATYSAPIADVVFYLGTEGKQQFAKEIGDKLKTSKQELEEFLSDISDDTVILIEGRVPTWVYQLLVSKPLASVKKQ